jgi:hypothetical protein
MEISGGNKMAQSDFPNSVWNGLTGDRPFTSLHRPPDQTDYEQIVAEIQAIQRYLIENPPSVGGSGGDYLLMGMNPNS